MKIEFCPRCGTKRPDTLKWCRKCGLNFDEAERGKLPPGVSSPTIRTVQNYFGEPEPQQPTSQWQQPYVPVVEVRPGGDRQSMARWSLHALEVRAGGTAGGCLGMAAGFLLFGYIGALIGGVAPIFLIPLGVLIGLFVGMRGALGLRAK